MALFLQESIEDSNADISIEEAYEGLIEASMDMQDLNEFILQNDFSIHEKNKTLTEAAATQNTESLIIKIANRIKNFILKVRDIVVRFFSKITSVFQLLWKKYQTAKQYLLLSDDETSKLQLAIAKIQKLQAALVMFNGKTAAKPEKNAILGLFSEIGRDLKEFTAFTGKTIKTTVTQNPKTTIAIIGSMLSLTAGTSAIKKVLSEQSYAVGVISNVINKHQANKSSAIDLATNPKLKGGTVKSLIGASKNSDIEMKLWQKELDNYKFSSNSFLSLAKHIGTVSNILRFKSSDTLDGILDSDDNAIDRHASLEVLDSVL